LAAQITVTVTLSPYRKQAKVGPPQGDCGIGGREHTQIGCTRGVQTADRGGGGTRLALALALT